MKTSLATFLLYPFLILFSLTAYGTQAVKDHPLLTRYQGAEIIRFDEREYDRYPLAHRVNSDGSVEQTHLEGHISTRIYSGSKSDSVLRAASNYKAALKKAGFTILVSCYKAECGGNIAIDLFESSNRLSVYRTLSIRDLRPSNSNNEFQYISAKQSQNDKTIYVALLIRKELSSNKSLRIAQDVIETKAMETNLVTVNAQYLADDISTKGRVVLEGLFFDSNQATLTARSEPALKQIADYLKTQSTSRFYVVGHTDNKGSYQYNIDLSQQRAAAVKEALVTAYQIDGKRLSAVGVGPVSPRSTNNQANGSSLNRRVELVAQ
ncbi:MAG: OmpA family protein [Cellvibrionaceae bacterium]|nr:OmpA family protein [Cellvibrionaceae bacterium]